MSNPRDWSALRLKDRIAPDLRVLFVGINPGVRSAQTGHHFAGFSNRFWKLLLRIRLVPEPITFEDDDRLTGVGLRDHQPVARPTPGIDDLRPGRIRRRRKVLRAQDPPRPPARRRARRRDRLSRGAAAVPGVDAAARGSTRSNWACSRRPSTARACSCCRIRAAATRISPITEMLDAFSALARASGDPPGKSLSAES